ncbi:hypothetical protein [Actinomadura sp. NTSP31]
MTTAATGTTLRYWAIASDGHRQATVMAGADPRNGEFSLSAGTLTKN